MSFISKRAVGLAAAGVMALGVMGAVNGVASAAPQPPGKSRVELPQLPAPSTPVAKQKGTYQPPMPTWKAADKSGPAPKPGTVRTLGVTGRQIVTSGTYAPVDPGHLKGIGVPCPAGLQVLGGGAYNTSSGGVVLTDSHPTGSSWVSYVYNTSGSAANVLGYAVCGSGVQRYEHNVNSSGAINTPARYSHLAACSAGDLKIVGGGFGTTSGTGTVRINGMFPDTHLNIWRTYFTKYANQSDSAYSHILCGTGFSRFEYSVKSATIAAGAYVSALATCPAGTSLLGGGGNAGDSTVTDSYPAGEGNSWYVYAKSNLPDVDQTMSVFAVCAA